VAKQYVQCQDPIQWEILMNPTLDEKKTRTRQSQKITNNVDRYEIGKAIFNLPVRKSAYVRNGLKKDTKIADFLRNGSLRGLVKTKQNK